MDDKVARLMMAAVEKIALRLRCASAGCCVSILSLFEMIAEFMGEAPFSLANDQPSVGPQCSSNKAMLQVQAMMLLLPRMLEHMMCCNLLDAALECGLCYLLKRIGDGNR